MSNQKGAALIITLIFLAIMMLFAVTALRTSTLDERLAANYQFSTVTDQGAEFAVTEVLRDYQKDVATNFPDHIFKQVWDELAREKFFPSSSFSNMYSTVTSMEKDNSKADYRAQVIWKSARYQRPGDDLRLHSMLFYIDGQSQYADKVGANAKHRVGISVPRCTAKHRPSRIALCPPTATP
ncbi:MAG: hypothetical protein DSZ33_06175 [Gammaproteobacteria bacterium]|nr:MAG: hypothetical protein DSZ33_06175 [Gammaproteobacteria bacterium]